jgi:membrane-bound lytic murein transglycosylase MltF
MSDFVSCRLRLGGIALAVVLSLPCFGAEVAVLRNGFSIRYEHRTVIGSVTRMYISADGSSYVDVPTAEIERVEAAEERPSALGLPESAGAALARTDVVNSLGNGSSCEFRGTGSLKPDCRSPRPDLNDVVNTASGRYRLDPDLVNSVIKAESGFNVRAVSRKGALGLMQLMPGTASELGVPNAFDPAANVDGGARYLRELLERYNFDLVKALAAYNAGTKRVEQYGGVPPYYETRAYVRRIVLDFNRKKEEQKKIAAQKSSANKKTRNATHLATGTSRSAPSLADAKARPVQASD